MLKIFLSKFDNIIIIPTVGIKILNSAVFIVEITILYFPDTILKFIVNTNDKTRNKKSKNKK